MRTIKFRGKNIKGKWVYGDLLRNRGETFIAPDGIADPLATADDFQVDPETVGQFTGLLDINGVEIYEGDIIQVGHESNRYKCRDRVSFIGDIKWNEASLCWDAGGQILVTLSVADSFYNIEIIGNVHDKPELLTED